MDRAEIVAKLGELKQCDSALEYFGAKVHQYKLRAISALCGEVI